MSQNPPYTPDPRFMALGPDFADPVAPAAFPKAIERFWNGRWAAAVGLDTLDEAARIAHFQRFEALPDNQPEPLAMRYHGHQFRSYNPQIGDGRGFLFAQLRDGQGRLLDLATKGSGQTPWSRTADGRLTLKGAVREILAAQMLEALGVYTSKIFAVFETGEPLQRHDEPSPTRSAVMTRLGHSHMRFGTFQRQAFEQSPERMTALVDHAIAQYYPALETAEDRPAALLGAVVAANARLAASWMAAGFVHGVLNTDNLNLTGESFDYGPWRFLPHYDPGFTAAYFDESGLYAYARQPEAVFWGLQQLAGALSLVGERAPLEAALNTFPPLYRQALLDAFLARFGVASRGDDNDEAMLRAFLAFMLASQLPWEAVMFDWFCGSASAERALRGPRGSVYAGEAFDAWQELLMQHAPVRAERLDHALFQRSEPVAMTIDVVEAIWARIAEEDDWSALETALADIALTRQGFDLGADRIGFLP
ncbi:YdiU family protein [uncultured Maricaulis sp.]|uniref:protein adenylyltransferase SelO family protein n=1 Tax=uncultured Maricaulis sp. TaxID=174710 RepID=UPI0030D9387D|tara:strand:+ start:288752 stop:290188 length:1437 start_codon:yes stop_codon:yes gene_type:complete